MAAAAGAAKIARRDGRGIASSHEHTIVKNRYDDVLRIHNREIIALTPANGTLRYVLACELRDIYEPGDRVLEIGCGEGESTIPLLEETTASLDVLDVSPEMIRSCKRAVAAFRGRVRFIIEDALAYLREVEPYDVILSSWTIHNFRWKEKRALLEAVYRNLAPGGSFLMMDKVYPAARQEQLLELQARRYRHLDPETRRAIIEHEKADRTDAYRIDEKSFLTTLRSIGFQSAVITDRVERDVVLVARK